MSEPVAQSAAQPSPVSQRWVVSARFDLLLLALPLVASLVLLAVPQDDDVPLWAFLGLIVLFDVSHVWSTLYMSYADGEAFERRRLLFLLPIPLTFLISFRLHAHSPELFWTVVAYIAIHHFVSQQWGFVALYKLRAGERFDRNLDKWTLWAGALGPLLLWHASPERSFDWFGHGEQFVLRLSPELKPDIAAAMIAVAVVYGVRQVQLARRGAFNLGKNLWMTASWASWAVGLGLAHHPLVSLACINLLHGIPFLGLVWFRLNQRWQGEVPTPARFVPWVAQRRNVAVFFGLIVGLALLEEGLWDGVVWGSYLDATFGVEAPELSATTTSFVVALLSLPQIVHYVLDGWLWTFDGSNPDLHHALGVPLPTRGPG
ncbi:hypothetical protein OAX78_01275 [Planctomycetota bacterium]|nr:hypothetical protein [Planctomycetota bacterium]